MTDIVVPEQLRPYLDANPDLAGGLEAAMLRGEASLLQEQVAALLDKADATEQQAVLDTAVADVKTALDTATELITVSVEQVKTAKQNRRQAEDRAEQAADHHRMLKAEYEDHSANLDAIHATDLLVKVQASDAIATDRKRDAEYAAEAHALAERSLAALRDAVRDLTVQHQAARDKAANPPAAPWSLWTTWLDGLRRICTGEEDRGGPITLTMIQALLDTTNLPAIWRAQGKKAAEAELRVKHPGLVR